MMVEALARLLATSSLAGTRASLTLLGLALAARFGLLEAPQEWMSSNVGLGILLALVVLEELAEQDEDLQAWVDLFAYALRGGAGALAAAGLQSVGLEQLPSWSLGLVGAGAAVATHHMRAKLHEQLAGFGEGLLSPRTWLAWLELGGVIGLLVAVVFAPVLALAFVSVAAVAGVAVTLGRRAAEDRLFRRPCPHCGVRIRVEASRCPGCRGAVEIQRMRD